MIALFPHWSFLQFPNAPKLEAWQIDVTVQEIVNRTKREIVKRADEGMKIVIADTFILPATLEQSETVSVVQVSAHNKLNTQTTINASE